MPDSGAVRETDCPAPASASGVTGMHHCSCQSWSKKTGFIPVPGLEKCPIPAHQVGPELGTPAPGLILSEMSLSEKVQLYDSISLKAARDGTRGSFHAPKDSLQQPTLGCISKGLYCPASTP